MYREGSPSDIAATRRLLGGMRAFGAWRQIRDALTWTADLEAEAAAFVREHLSRSGPALALCAALRPDRPYH
jgi:hypothetical protein